MKKNVENFYDILGVSRTVDASELKKAYHKKLLETHPDKNEGKDTNTEFCNVTKAYQILSNTEERAAHDEALNNNHAQNEGAAEKPNKAKTEDNHYSTSTDSTINRRNYASWFKSSSLVSTDSHFNLLYKFVLIGSIDSQKTRIMRAILHGEILRNSTIGLDFGQVIIKHQKFGPVKLHLWDTNGQEGFKTLTRVYVRDTAAYIIVIDIHSEDSWKESCDQVRIMSRAGQIEGKQLSLILIKNSVNKDLNTYCCSDEDISSFRQRYNIKSTVKVNLDEEDAFKPLRNFLAIMISQIREKENKEIKTLLNSQSTENSNVDRSFN